MTNLTVPSMNKAAASRTKAINNFISYQLQEVFTWPYISFSDVLFFHVILQLVLNKTAVKARKINQQTLLEILRGYMRRDDLAIFINSNTSMLDSLYAGCQPRLVTACDPKNSRKYGWIKEWEQICTGFTNEDSFDIQEFEAISMTIQKNIGFKDHQLTIVMYILERLHSSANPLFI